MLPPCEPKVEGAVPKDVFPPPNMLAEALGAPDCPNAKEAELDGFASNMFDDSAGLGCETG